MEEMRIELAALTRKELQALAKQGKNIDVNVLHPCCGGIIKVQAKTPHMMLLLLYWCALPTSCSATLEGIRANGRSADIIETLLQAAFPEVFPESKPPQHASDNRLVQYRAVQLSLDWTQQTPCLSFEGWPQHIFKIMTAP
jgi:hypothetical protein